MRRWLQRSRNTLRLMRREPSLLRHGPSWWWHLFRHHPLGSRGRPWILSDPHLRPQDYREWVDAVAALAPAERERATIWLAEQHQLPRISVLLPVYNPNPAWLQEAIASVRSQTYPHWQLCIADDASSDRRIRRMLNKLAKADPRIQVVFRAENGHISQCSNSALALADGDWLALLDHDDRLSSDALMWVAQAIVSHPEAKLFYSDEDKITPHGLRYDPYFKCAWNPALQEGHHMFAHLGVYNAALVRRLGGFRQGFEGSQDYDLTLRCLAEIDADQVVHIPRVLYHWRAHQFSVALSPHCKLYAAPAAQRALQEHVDRQGIQANVVATPVGFRVQLHPPDSLPLVSVVVPTRNRLEVLEPCLRSLLERTAYPNLQLLVVDNGSDDPACLRYLAELQADARVRVLRDPREFNYAALNNAAVAVSDGELVLLLNNDIEATDPDWLTEMVVQIMRPRVGAVGAKLVHQDGRIQHAGVILGMGGVAAHGHRDYPVGDPGYFGRIDLVQDLSSVTGACLLVWRRLYQELGGLDERLVVAFNDVDFCLRLRQAGQRVLYTPHACLIHHESVSRGAEQPQSARFQAEQALMRERWGDVLQNDPAYSPHLSLDRPDFSLPWPPRPLMGARTGVLRSSAPAPALGKGRSAPAAVRSG